ncbi:hypothetical protein [Cupriavidus oxalaticus]|uniref:Transmembrane protein n=1 Tax=Cupriavidus oxalaticus TaxID=96344 RepID=A0A976BD25_9BURK|nr:hypothetical protein [Cupriavidus oxalaticus]QRQ88192.1 hypothetical protein JTE91_16510 [Cupriavidus oxalaticus]QRQ93481.1 hypothetical protein JTE92_25750 [Cupriavidus oxalaticus]WQD82106.1 hypothetical protein U0036_13495 [Cupriavidus oxalaticus]SPC14202.1 conserved membrane hypothetical protein [Cupriavidus oxalaticus]
MKRVAEFLRFFFVGPEMLVVVIGVLLRATFSDQVSHLISGIRISDDQLKWVIAVPAALFVWSLTAGRKLLFPEKDKEGILQQWPDYWRLRLGFHVALLWGFIFLSISMAAWAGDWKNPSVTDAILLAVSITGSGLCALSIYNAQTQAEEAVSRYKARR